MCRCGASKNKPFCDGSHNAAGFDASGEPPSRETDALPIRDGVLAIDRGDVLVLANFHDAARPIDRGGGRVDMLTCAAAGETIPAYGILWLARD